MELLIRPAVAGDLEAVWALCERVRARLVMDKIAMWDEDYPNREIFSFDLSSGCTIAAELDGRLAGTICASPDIKDEFFFDCPRPDDELERLCGFCGCESGSTLGLHRLMVDPVFRKRGVATALMRELERLHAGKTLLLLTAPSNSAAIRLYGELGYRDFGDYDFTFGPMRLMTKKAGS